MGARRGVLGAVRQIINEISESLYEAEANGKPTHTRSHDASSTDEKFFTKKNLVSKPSELVSEFPDFFITVR